MSKSLIDAWSSTLSIWASTPSWPAQPGDGNAALSTGNFIASRLDSDEGALEYKLFIPSTYDGSPMPLIVTLHGCG